MRFAFRLAFLCVLCASVVNGFCLDREAFTFANYDLNVQIDPDQHRLGVRGKITLRNDSEAPEKIAVLQISSSLDWRSIKASNKPLQFVAQPYTSDIDHTGALSEAIVTLPEPVTPKGTIELEVAYEGVVVLDTTRLTRIGTPEKEAQSSDWDEIGPAFTALRGAGYVAWYPIATEPADLSEPNSLFDVLGRWKSREAAARMMIHVSDTSASDGDDSRALCSGEAIEEVVKEGTSQVQLLECSTPRLAFSTPALAIAKFGLIQREALDVFYLPGHDASAASYADAAEKAETLIVDWLGKPRRKAQTVDLSNGDAPPFESGPLLFTPLAGIDPKLAALAGAHQLTHAAFSSARPWIDEGLAHFMQALYLEREKGRQAALDYMSLHRSALSTEEKPTRVPRSEDEVNRSLINTASEEVYRSKALCVWWMLRDMVGDIPLKKALASYKAAEDKDPSYMPRLIQAQTQRDLEWFFDDWVYRDRGLPNFKVDSVFPRKTLSDTYIVTITVENLGSAGAEVPLTVQSAGGSVTKRLEVHGKDKAVIRVEVSGLPREVTVNDGSVPESDMTNNTFKITSEQQ
jgi:hypothetical protein